MVDIKGLEKEDVLKALYYSAKRPPRPTKPTMPISPDIAYEIATNPELKFGKIAGRIINCDISGDSFDETSYDEHAGKGTAQKAIDKIREEILEEQMYQDRYNLTPEERELCLTLAKKVLERCKFVKLLTPEEYSKLKKNDRFHEEPYKKFAKEIGLIDLVNGENKKLSFIAADIYMPLINADSLLFWEGKSEEYIENYRVGNFESQYKIQQRSFYTNLNECKKVYEELKKGMPEKEIENPNKNGDER